MKKIPLFLLAAIVSVFGSILSAQNYTTYTEQQILNGVYRPSNQSLLLTIAGLSPTGSQLTTNYIWVGDATGLAAEVEMTGDVSIISDGTTAIGTGKVTNAMLAGSIVSSKLTGAMTFGSSVTITGTGGLLLTYGVNAATAVLTGAADIAGQVTMGAAGTKSTVTVLGAASFAASVYAPAYTGATLALTGAADVAGQLTWGTAGTKSTATVLGALSIPGVMTASSYVGIVSSITLASMYGAPTLTGTNITALPAASVAAGSLAADVIASSITLASMYGAPTLTGTNITGVPPASLVAGNLIITVKPYSSSDCEALTPAAEGEWCYDTGTHKLEISTSTGAGGFEAVH